MEGKAPKRIRVVVKSRVLEENCYVVFGWGETLAALEADRQGCPLRIGRPPGARPARAGKGELAKRIRDEGSARRESTGI